MGMKRQKRSEICRTAVEELLNGLGDLLLGSLLGNLEGVLALDRKSVV